MPSLPTDFQDAGSREENSIRLKPHVFSPS